MKSRIVDYSCPDKYDPDFDLDSDDSLSDHLINASTTTFNGMRVFDSINPVLTKSHFTVSINGTKRFLHKQTAAWFLSKNKSSLSSDRLKRVMTNE
jgi:hypothetical protein